DEGGLMLMVPQGSALGDAGRALGAPLRVIEWGVDVGDPDDWWGRVAGLSDETALLVRPDQYVAARFAVAGANASMLLLSTLKALGFVVATGDLRRAAEA